MSGNQRWIQVQNSERSKDFIHILSIVQKECDETIYWLELLRETDFLVEKEFEGINNKVIE